MLSKTRKFTKKKSFTQFQNKVLQANRRRRMLSNNQKKILWRQRTFITITQ